MREAPLRPSKSKGADLEFESTYRNQIFFSEQIARIHSFDQIRVLLLESQHGSNRSSYSAMVRAHDYVGLTWYSTKW